MKSMKKRSTFYLFNYLPGFWLDCSVGYYNIEFQKSMGYASLGRQEICACEALEDEYLKRTLL